MPRGLYISSLLLRDFKPEERQFVIAHELAHVKLGHLKYRQNVRSLILVLYAILALLLLLKLPIQFLATAALIALMAVAAIGIISRKVIFEQEYQADSEAIRTLPNPEALKSALYRVAANSMLPQLMEFEPHPPEQPQPIRRR
jgi:Zn-dependent protease with chaperone function